MEIDAASDVNEFHGFELARSRPATVASAREREILGA